MNCPDFIILSAFRYALGRQTYIVRLTVDWLIYHWNGIPPRTRDLIERDLEEAFRADKRGVHYSPLGGECDKEDWTRLLTHIRR